MVKLALPLRPGVPQWLGIITMFVILLPIMLLNGAYTGSMVEVSNTLGVLSEDITMAYYSASVGMAVAYPIVPKFRAVITSKTILLADLVLQIGFSLICAHTGNMTIITVCSFFIGFLKAFVMLEFIILIRPLFSPKNIRSEFYAYFYPIVFAGGQLSSVITAQLAYYYQWQYMYHFVIILLLTAILFVLLFFRYMRRPVQIPFREIDWRSIFLVALALLMTLYLFSYGKTLDWFDSPRIWLCTLLAPLLLFLFVYRQRTNKKPYISLQPLSSHKSIIGYFFMVLVMFLTATGSLITNYENSILRLDSIHTNSLNLWLLPGFIVGAMVCFWWFRLQRWRFRYLVSSGLFCYVAYLSMLYFGITSYSRYEALCLPMIFRGMGMIIIFIAFGVFVVEDLNPKLMLSNAFFLIVFRSALAPVISASFFNNMLYRMQLKGMNILCENMTLTDNVAAGRYTQSLNTALMQGHGFDQASQMATNGLYTTLQQQSLLWGIKALLGSVLILALVFAIGSAFIPFHKTIRVSVVKTGDDMV